MLPDATTAILMTVIEHKIVSNSIIYLVVCKSYNVLDDSAFHHLLVDNLELGEAPHTYTQRCSKGTFRPILDGTRVAF